MGMHRGEEEAAWASLRARPFPTIPLAGSPNTSCSAKNASWDLTGKTQSSISYTGRNNQSEMRTKVIGYFSHGPLPSPQNTVNRFASPLLPCPIKTKEMKKEKKKAIIIKERILLSSLSRVARQSVKPLAASGLGVGRFQEGWAASSPTVLLLSGCPPPVASSRPAPAPLSGLTPWSLAQAAGQHRYLQPQDSTTMSSYCL